MQTFKVLKKANGIETLIGKITFDGTFPPKLTVEAQGPEGEQLKEDWEAVIAEKRLPMEVNEVAGPEGGEVLEMNVELVSRDDERYPSAVWSYLESHYNYLVDLDHGN